MGDFSQNGIITTLHNLAERPVEELEKELTEFAHTRPLGLVLPSLYSELQTKALPDIISKLRHVPYLSQIVIGLDRANQAQYQHALRFFKQLPQHHRVLWNDGPRLRALESGVPGAA
jgi:glucosyl-3-phosphoglycerate synthase